MIPEQERCYECYKTGEGYDLLCSNYLRIQAMRKQHLGVECIWSRTIKADLIKLITDPDGACLTFPEIARQIIKDREEQDLEDAVAREALTKHE